jgi:hypothetical protein
MTAKATAKTDKNQERENLGWNRQKQLDRELDRELGDSFPASDPPSLTQPGGLKPGGPERKDSRRR